MAKPSVSHHLNILKNANLITYKKKGQNIIYSINTSVLEDIFAFIADLKDK